MAKTPKQYEKEILKVIKENPDIVFISYIFNEYTGCTRQNFYLVGLDKFDSIKEAIELNRTKKKAFMLPNWMEKEASPVLQVAAMKLMGTTDERKRLSQTYIENTGPDGGPIKYTDMTDEALNQRLEELRKLREDSE